MKTETLKKVRELALRGIDGEKKAAQTLLDKLMEKYHIDESELDDNERKRVVFYYHGKDEKALLIQVACKVTNDLTYYKRRNQSGRVRKTEISKDCTEAERIQILFLFDFYKELYKREADFFMKAFLNKHDLFAHSDDIEKTYCSPEDSAKIISMMRGLSDESPTPRLEDKNNKEE